MDLNTSSKFKIQISKLTGNTITFTAVGALVFVMLLTAFLSMRQDSLTYDELAHISAGYSYLTQQDYRLNPEHPPLAKDLSAFPLLFLRLNFPSQSENWLQNSGASPWWTQFNFGRDLLFNSGNNLQQIIFWARLPMIFLYLVLGLFLFWWARKLLGNVGGIFTFALYAFSPTFLAHGRLVTNDIAASFGALFATYFWIQFLKNPSKKNIFVAGIAFGLAMSLKFNLVLLVPFFGILTFVYPLVSHSVNTPKAKLLLQYIGKASIAGIVGLFIVVWPIYQFHIWNYPPARQVRDTISDLSPGGINGIEKITIFLSDKPLLRPFAQFARGILMVNQRVVFGNTTYFLGRISSSAQKNYFPVLFFTKEPLGFYALLFLALGGVLISLKKTKSWFTTHFSIVAGIIFIAVYWISALIGNLNIGIRHLLPTFPFLYLFIGWGTLELFKFIDQKALRTSLVVSVLVLLSWFIFSSIRAFPFYISYFNELGGGTKNGYKIAVDSNYDWGQDFYRLLALVKKYKIDKLYLDYFGGEDPAYYLGSAYVPLNPQNETIHPAGWVAVSVNQLMGGIAKPVLGFNQQTGYYDWLLQYTPVDRAGNSIFLYYILPKSNFTSGI